MNSAVWGLSWRYISRPAARMSPADPWGTALPSGKRITSSKNFSFSRPSRLACRSFTLETRGTMSRAICSRKAAASRTSQQLRLRRS